MLTSNGFPIQAPSTRNSHVQALLYAALKVRCYEYSAVP